MFEINDHTKENVVYNIFKSFMSYNTLIVYQINVLYIIEINNNEIINFIMDTKHSFLD